jgi:MYXO-CTERM domain-containing protein
MAWAPACVGGVPGVCVPGSPTPEWCNGADDDCNGLVDDTLIDCVPPDAGPPDAGTDAGPPDGGSPMLNDAGARCVGPSCDPWVLEGRAGPIGRCHCRAAGAGDMPALPAALALALGAAIVIRRRRR